MVSILIQATWRKWGVIVRIHWNLWELKNKTKHSDLHGSEITTLFSERQEVTLALMATVLLFPYLLHSPFSLAVDFLWNLSWLCTYKRWMPYTWLLHLTLHEVKSQYFLLAFVILHILCHLFRISRKGNLIGSGYLFKTGLKFRHKSFQAMVSLGSALFLVLQSTMVRGSKSCGI